MSNHRRARAAQRRRYYSIMKDWRRLSQIDPNQQALQRKRRRQLLEELRALEVESDDQE